MEKIKLSKIRKLSGEFIAPSDKSISQRAAMISAIAQGKTRILNFLDCDDCRWAISAFKKMQVKMRLLIDKGQTVLEVEGKGPYGLQAPKSAIYLGNSGTTMRLISGILIAQKFKSKLRGDKALSKRPMKRIIEPLRQMGAEIHGFLRQKEEYPPLAIKGNELKAIKYKMPLSSAQVKSSILLAGLYAQGKTKVQEKLKTRDHTERMLKLFQADLKTRGLSIIICGQRELISPESMFIPGDISSCAFFIVAATLVKDSRLIIRKVGLNPTRTYLLKILKRMGAKIKIIKNNLNAYEPYGDLFIQSAVIKATTVTKDEVAFCIDELPILTVAACLAKGTTKICGVAELRIKETDRIHSMVTNLKKMGASIENRGNDLIVNGPRKLKGARLESFGDHRTAMSMAIAGLLAEQATTINDTECINKSFPDFMNILKSLISN